MKRTRRYRPKRTYRRRYRKHTESSTLTGVSYGDVFRCNQLYQGRFNDTESGIVVFDSNGNIYTGPNTASVNRFWIFANDIIGLQERLKLYKQYRIKKIEYQFYKEGLSANNGMIGTADYIGNWTTGHSKVIYNYTDNLEPDGRIYTQNLQLYIDQLRGRHLNTLTGRKKTIAFKPTIIENAQFDSTSDGNVTVQKLSRFPWLDVKKSLNTPTNIACGRGYTFIPMVDFTMNINNNTIPLDLTTQEGRLAAVRPFQWYCRPKITWEVRGKYYSYTLAETPTENVVANDLSNMNIE